MMIIKIHSSSPTFFGELALFTNTKRTADIHANSFCIADVLTRTSWNKLKSIYPNLENEILDNLH